MKVAHISLSVVLALVSTGFTLSANADTVKARCDVFPKGEDKAKSSGLCNFSQRQGAVSIQLSNGTRYELTPVGSDPGNYKDQNGRPAYRQSGLGDRGQIYRLATESVFVYWDTAPFGENGGSSPVASASEPAVGTPVSALQDLVGAKSGQAENTLIQRGYKFAKSASSSSNSAYAYWRETKTNFCISVVTENGRFNSFVYVPTSSCN